MCLVWSPCLQSDSISDKFPPNTSGSVVLAESPPSNHLYTLQILKFAPLRQQKSAREITLEDSKGEP